MTRFRPFAAAALAGAVTAVVLIAQTPAPGGAAPGRGGRGAPPPAVRSPEVNPDRSVTLRLRAPQARLVQLANEITQGKGALDMTKDAGGVWSITVGPLVPDIWIYCFRIDGVDFPDPMIQAVAAPLARPMAGRSRLR